MRRSLVITAMMVLSLGFALQAPSDCAAQANKDVPRTKTKTGFELIEGRWLRPDGGYIVQIRSIDANGTMDTEYFNPRPVNVSKAQATRDGGKMKVLIELSDVGYPGSTYALAYDHIDDVLRGVYYQAAMKQSFDVYFTRMK